MFNNIKADMKRYSQIGGFLNKIGFWITLLYRFGSWGNRQFFLIKIPVKIIHAILVLPIRMIFKVYIPTKTCIGPGLLLEHPFNILIPAETVIGENCTIFHEVTLGRGSIPALPQIADNVILFPGSKILGGIKIGSNAHIGANVVVLRNVPEWTFLLPPKPQIIKAALAKALKNNKE